MTVAPDVRSRVTVLAGFSASTTEAVAQTLLTTADTRMILLCHDLSGVRDGLVYRSVRTADGVLETGLTEMVHGCVSCTLREDVLPALVHLSRRFPGDDILLVLPPVIEPEAVAAAAEITVVDEVAVTSAVRFDSFTTVVDPGTFLDDLTSADSLRDRGLHAADNDDRGVADLLCRQVEFADTVVVHHRPGDDSSDDSRLHTLVHRLAPWAVHVHTTGDSPADDAALTARLLRSGRHDPAVPGMPGRALDGYPVGVHDPTDEHGVTAVLFHSRRPFHPHRLHDALDDLAGEALRGRGQLWIASQSDTAIAWESAGGDLLLGSLGPWLAALPHDRWDEAGAMRRLVADADWDPRYGDRRTALAFIGLELDGTAVTALLQSCLLSDDEISMGTAAWDSQPDPFAGFFPANEQSEPVAISEGVSS